MTPKQRYGHGVGLRVEHYAEMLERGPAGVDWMEIISENFFEPGGRPWRVLEAVRREVDVVAHGVSLGIGNTDPICERYLRTLEELIARIEPAWVSDHLCWGAFGGHVAHDLLPLPFTEEALAHISDRVTFVQERLGRRILLENVSSYVTFVASELTEWEFLVELAKRTDCGLLLDLNNIYVSSVNHGFSAEAYVDAIPIERIGQIHLAGHTDRGSYLLDSHLGPVPDVVWSLYERLLVRTAGCGGREIPVLIEWDEEVPAFDVLAAEVAVSRDFEQRIFAEAAEAYDRQVDAPRHSGAP